MLRPVGPGFPRIPLELHLGRLARLAKSSDFETVARPSRRNSQPGSGSSSAASRRSSSRSKPRGAKGVLRRRRRLDGRWLCPEASDVPPRWGSGLVLRPDRATSLPIRRFCGQRLPIGSIAPFPWKHRPTETSSDGGDLALGWFWFLNMARPGRARRVAISRKAAKTRRHPGHSSGHDVVALGQGMCLADLAKILLSPEPCADHPLDILCIVK